MKEVLCIFCNAECPMGVGTRWFEQSSYHPLSLSRAHVVSAHVARLSGGGGVLRSAAAPAGRARASGAA